jgi:hypothetical protein
VEAGCTRFGLLAVGSSLTPADLKWYADTRFGGAEEIRTPDLLLAKETLYQLSHGPGTMCDLRPEAQVSIAGGRPEIGTQTASGRFWTRTRDLCLIRAVL